MSERKYCICRSTDGTGFMILCEQCDEWFHGCCIKITEEESEWISRYFCAKCIALHPALKIRYKRSGMKNTSRGYQENDLDEDDSEPPCKLRQYYVRDILDKKTFEDGKVRYLVKWADYDSDANSWEPPSNLSTAQFVVERFERRLKRRENGEKSSSEDSHDDKENDNEGGKDGSSGSSDSESSSGTETEPEPSRDDEDDRETEINEGGSTDGEQDEKDTPNKTNEKGNVEGEGTPSGEFCLLEELPDGFEPTRMLLALPLRKGGLCYMIECKNKEEELEPVFIYADCFRRQFPLIVIEFYEQHIKFTEDVYPSDDENSEGQSEEELEPEQANEEVMQVQEDAVPSPPPPPTSTIRRDANKRKGSTSKIDFSSSSSAAGADSSDDNEVLANISTKRKLVSS